RAGRAQDPARLPAGAHLLGALDRRPAPGARGRRLPAARAPRRAGRGRGAGRGGPLQARGAVGVRRLLPLLLLLAAAPAAAENWQARCAAALPAEAFKPCEEALIDNPNDLVALKRLGDFSLGNHAEWRAVELYGRRILLDP